MKHPKKKSQDSKGYVWQVSDKIKVNFNRYLKDIMDSHYKKHIDFFIKSIKKREINSVSEAKKIIVTLYSFKINETEDEWKFNLIKELEDLDFPINNEEKLEKKIKEFSEVIVSTAWKMI